eukprot:364599-Chlamydomonas_euryale.AAC.13
MREKCGVRCVRSLQLESDPVAHAATADAALADRGTHMRRAGVYNEEVSMKAAYRVVFEQGSGKGGNGRGGNCSRSGGGVRRAAHRWCAQHKRADSLALPRLRFRFRILDLRSAQASTCGSPRTVVLLPARKEPHRRHASNAFLSFGHRAGRSAIKAQAS